jgi:hypothetical protein
MHRTYSWVFFQGLGDPMRRVLGGAMMVSRPVGARGRKMCGPYVMSAIFVMPFLCGFPMI